MEMRTITWGPRAGQKMTKEQAAAYNAQYPANDAEYAAYQQANGLSNITIAAAQPEGSTGANLGPAITDPTQLANITDQVTFYQPARLGLQGDSYWDKFYADQMSPSGLQMPGFDTANQDQARAEQQRVIQELQAQAAGDPNSQAQQQLQQGYQQAQGQQSSLGSTMRGQSAGAARQGIAAGQQGIQRGFAGDQQMLMLQEQQAAQAMLAQLLGQQHGQDVNQAGLMSQGKLQGDALNQAMSQFYTQGNIQQQVGNAQYGSEYNRAMAGMDLEAKDLTTANNKRIAAAGAAATGTIAEMYKPKDKKKSSEDA